MGPHARRRSVVRGCGADSRLEWKVSRGRMRCHTVGSLHVKQGSGHLAGSTVIFHLRRRPGDTNGVRATQSSTEHLQSFNSPKGTPVQGAGTGPGVPSLGSEERKPGAGAQVGVDVDSLSPQASG